MTRRYQHALKVVRLESLDPELQLKLRRLRLEAEAARIEASQAREGSARRARWATVALRFEAEFCEALVGSLAPQQLSN